MLGKEDSARSRNATEQPRRRYRDINEFARLAMEPREVRLCLLKKLESSAMRSYVEQLAHTAFLTGSSTGKEQARSSISLVAEDDARRMSSGSVQRTRKKFSTMSKPGTRSTRLVGGEGLGHVIPSQSLRERPGNTAKFESSTAPYLPTGAFCLIVGSYRQTEALRGPAAFLDANFVFDAYNS